MKGLFKDIKYDLPAGLVLFFVALPLCLGIALAGSYTHLDVYKRQGLYIIPPALPHDVVAVLPICKLTPLFGITAPEPVKSKANNKLLLASQ